MSEDVNIKSKDVEVKRANNRSRSIKLMIVLIVMFIIGIATRWSFISSEVQETMQRMFPTEQGR